MVVLKRVKKDIKINNKNGSKNFLVFFSAISSKKIMKMKIKKGILFPERIIPDKKIKNIMDTKYLLYFFIFEFSKNNGIIKKENNENLCMKPPAINSSPKGPDNFRLFVQTQKCLYHLLIEK